MYSWLHRKLSWTNNNTQQNVHKLQTSTTHKQQQQQQQHDDEFYGVTNQLIEFVKSFTFDTFKNFSLSEEESGEIETTSGGVRVDLSDWQQHHALIILSKLKELSKLRYMLCPRHMKEHQFWRIYFSLVKSYVTEYELQAIRLDKLRKMEMESEKAPLTNVVELEMTEAKLESISAPP